MIKLQKPAFAYMGGKVIPWDQATLHVGCEAATKGLNVLEGLKGYWHDHGGFGIIFLKKHFERLKRSARLLQIPCPLYLRGIRTCSVRFDGVYAY